MSLDVENEKATLTGNIPGFSANGTEIGGKNLTIRENGGVYEIYDEGASSVVMTLESHKTRHEPSGADTLTRIRSVKRNTTGSVVFATATDARGTNTTSAATASLTVSLAVTANFNKAKAIIGTTNTVTAGSAVTLKLLDGTSLLTSAAGAAPTTLSVSVPNSLVTAPNASLAVGGMTGGTVTAETLSLLLNQLTTLGV